MKSRVTFDQIRIMTSKVNRGSKGVDYYNFPIHYNVVVAKRNFRMCMCIERRSRSGKSPTVTRAAEKGCFGYDKSALANLKCSFTFVCNSRMHFKPDTRVLV